MLHSIGRSPNNLPLKILNKLLPLPPDDSKPFFVETDASDYGIGGVMSQINSDNLLQPIAFYSRQLNFAERNYTIYDKELLAVYACFEEWWQFRHDVYVGKNHV